jgi:beta-lactamase regulating signal transducer with metallopeptidase domain
MSAIAWLSREEIVALGWTLLHFCWQGTAVAVAYAVVDRMTSKATSKVRYAVALSAFMLMPLVVLGTFAMEIRVATPTAQTKEAAPVITGFLFTDRTPTVHELPLASGFAQQEEWLVIRAERLMPWVDGFWLIGVLLLALRSLGGWWQLELIRRHALRMVPQEVERSFQRIREQVHAGRKVALRISDQVISPLAMGVWRTTVILPMSAVTGMPKEELEAVMAHELGHIRRWDFIWNLMQTAVESVLFFHPAVWRLSRIVRERREVCCDEIAVECCAGAAVYARALLRLEEQRAVNLRMAMALGGCGGSLLGRVRKVLGEDIAMEDRMTSGVSVATAGAVVMALLLGPKAGTAVAAPVLYAVRPVVAQVVQAMPGSMLSQMPGVNSRVMVPDPAIAPAAGSQQDVATPMVAPAAPITAPPSTPMVAPVAPTTEAWPTPKAAPSAPKATPSTTPMVAPPAPKATPKATPLPAPHAIPSLPPQAFINTTRPRLVAMTFMNMAIFERQETSGSAQSKGTTYIDGMRAAGYPLDLNNDLNELFALKSMGVTPEYAKSMGATGLGKPTVHELITLKSMGVTPEYVASLKQSGMAPKDFHEVVTEKSLGITPAYAAEMKQKGFGDLNVHELVTMKSMGITPEYAAEMTKGFGTSFSVHELVAMKAMGVTPEYAAAMKQKGFGDLSVHELISLKAQGMTPEQAGWLKQQFPQATTDELRRAAVFHLDERFVADAKSHGFDDKNLDKLIKLKISGLMDQ